MTYSKVVLGLGVHTARAYWLVRALSKVSVGAIVCEQRGLGRRPAAVKMPRRWAPSGRSLDDRLSLLRSQPASLPACVLQLAVQRGTLVRMLGGGP